MTTVERLSVVAAAPVDEAMILLRDAVRAEFRGPVLEPPAGHPVLTSGVCAVAECDVPAGARGWVCGGHRAMFYREAMPAGLSRQEWIASNPAQIKTYERSVRPCLVEWCSFGDESQGLCTRHAQRWRLSARPPLAEFAGSVPRDSQAIAAAEQCQVRACDLWAVPTHGYCRAHQSRYRRRVRAGQSVTPEDFQSWLDAHGDHQLSVGHLPGRLRLEVQYAVQTYVDRGTAQLHLAQWNAPVDFLVQSGVHSVLDRSATEWVAAWDVARRRPGRGFFGWAHDELDKLINGSGWDSEFPRDVWRVNRLSPHGAGAARLDFSRIPQPWLRELAKRWSRHRLSVGLTAATAYSGLRAITALAGYLHLAGVAESSPADLTREYLDRWLATVTATRTADQAQRFTNEMSVFLRDVHHRQWAPELPANVAVVTQDRVRHRIQRSPRALSEYVMRQLETQLDRFEQPDTRLITEIVMRTGLRGQDARKLQFDCVVHDDKAHPYLRYFNHKMRRTADTPVDPDLATRIAAQQDRAAERFRFAPPLLFPGRMANPSGDKPLSRSAWVVQLETWLQAIDVTDENGRPVTLVPHQFRHTFGTRMINNGVPQHIVQHLLDHTSPDMTAHYAQLHDATVRTAWAKARKINAHGDEVTLPDDHPLSEVSWLRAGLDRAKQTLPNGYCGMPAHSPCEHANPCLTCPLFLTTPEFLPQHQAQHRITLNLIDTARRDGHHRVVEKNEQVAANLERIITACQSCQPAQVVAGGKIVTPGVADAS